MRFFLAGIMQGSHLAATIHHQGYRTQIKQLIEQRVPDAVIYDPLADHANSLAYDDQQARGVFFHHCELCREVDAVVAYLPEASMGTAVEMWEAIHHGVAVIVITPMRLNWAVKFLSHAIYPDLEAFAEGLANGRVLERIREVRGSAH